MIHFGQIDQACFLSEYWQKKPLLIKQALPNFISPLAPEELAGLALEDGIESRLVIQQGTEDYQLRHGPFTEQDFMQLPEQNWTLLVQGMDKLIPEIHQLLTEFDFIPRWRLDDVMISYASEGGNVGPHYDHYDVFLLQAAGTRRWQITSQNCQPENYLPNIALRLLQEFKVEDEWVLEPGDILYLPPKWGHHGVAMDSECMTFSIGYRSYKAQELWDSFGDYLAEQSSGLAQAIYQDPNWQNTRPGEVPDSAWQHAQQQLLALAQDDQAMQAWFGRFATQLDEQSHQQLPDPLSKDEQADLTRFQQALAQAERLERDPVCRFAYSRQAATGVITLYINGTAWPVSAEIGAGVIMELANQPFYNQELLARWAKQRPVTQLLYELWCLQYVIFPDEDEQAECFEGEG
ncbi:cupin domain-containing protein [Thiomicrospira cyclica]|uniref:Cupin 4 family protein n=1 Tax=Thiomicrospira cyclica (strain DSM 14477 / JCM 11371 / ALM1) TaxID=717773 RepID=F6DC48_THICA|nr:cupin domain-containing protein [Thiomicrospira cyclica]AEG31434.1 Cupin 4 family protein [Thiomicrospira cyclica ALM1]